MILKKEQIAAICHAANKQFCDETGDNSQVAWELAPEWQRNSAINGVEFHLKNETTPEQSHENWLKEKIADGWIYGKIKNVEKKEHPCMVAYNLLPLEQQIKDYIFKAIVDVFKKAELN